MLLPEIDTHTPERGEVEVPEAQRLLPTELDFYQAYAWCLNPFPTVREAIGYLRGEIGRLEIVPDGWQRGEVATNVLLLSCALLNAADEYIRGPTLRMPRQLAARRLGRNARWVTEKIWSSLRQRRRAQVCRWRERWQTGLDDFFSIVVAADAPDPTSLPNSSSR